MFEQEIEMEKHQSAVVPLLLIAGLIVAVVGVAGYFLIQNHKGDNLTRSHRPCGSGPEGARSGYRALPCGHGNRQRGRKAA